MFASIVIALFNTIDNLSLAIDDIVGFVAKFVPNTSSFTPILLFIALAKLLWLRLDTAFATQSKAGSYV